MNKAQSRLLWKALQDGGYIFKKLESAGRAARDTSPVNQAESSRHEDPEMRPIPLNCYPAQGKEGISRCFLFGTLVPVMGGAKIAVEELQEGRDAIIGPSGRPLHVAAVKRHEWEWRWLVELTAQGARLKVTETHRMQRWEKAKWVDTEAGDLQRGDFVLCTEGRCRLDAVEHLYQEAKTVEVVVNPDEVFQAFHAPSTSFLCKGQAGQAGEDAPLTSAASSSGNRLHAVGVATRRNRRGGQNLRDATAAANRWNRANLDQTDLYSHVDTLWSEY